MTKRAVASIALCAVVVGGITTPASARRRPPPARHWDERVRDLVEFVEDERGLEFDHPVAVRFLSDARFERLLRGDADPSQEEERLAEQVGGELLALGLIEEGVDLGETNEDLTVTGTVGFYDFEEKELVVRGRDVRTVEARVTVVHELTHALQDQQFDLDELYDGAKDGSEELALDFLVEGDASTVERAYLESLPRRVQERYFRNVAEFVEDRAPDPGSYALDVYLNAPYVLGEPFVYALDPDGGTAGRNRAFRAPPKTEEALIDPLALRQRQRAEKVPAPTLAAGEKKAYDPEQFGVITLYLMLATRLDPRTALDAVTGWGGDRYVGFEKDDASCVRINISGDTRRDTRQVEDALAAWSATMPEGAASLDRAGDVVTLTACEAPGITVPAVEVFDRAFYNVLAGRIYVVLDLVSAGLPLRAARCVGDRVSTDPAVVAAFDAAIAENRDPTDDDYAVVDEAYEAAFPRCGVAPPR